MRRALAIGCLALLAVPVTRAVQLFPIVSKGGVVSVPVGGLEQTLPNPAFGVTGFGGVRVGATPIVFGVEGSLSAYGASGREVILSLDIPNVLVTERTVNHIATAHFVVRAQRQRGPMMVYGEALLGTKYFFTETRVHGTTDRRNLLSAVTDYDDFATSYGIGGGTAVRLYRGLTRDLAISGGVRYLMGGPARYLTHIRLETGGLRYDEVRSNTHMIMMYLGLALEL